MQKEEFEVERLAQAGLIKQGCLPDQYVPLSLNMEQSTPFVVPEAEKTAFARRWRLLRELEDAGRPATLRNASFREFESFYVACRVELR